jgi:hypothetical protein
MTTAVQDRAANLQVRRASNDLWTETATIFVVCFLVTFISNSGVRVGLADLLNVGNSVSGGIEPLAIAKSLAASGKFEDPFITPTGPTAHLGPIYPLYLAAILLAAKNAGAQAMLLHLGASLFHALELALLPLLSVAVFGEVEIGFIAGLLGILIPCYKFLPLWDSSLAGLATIGFCLAAMRVDARSASGFVGLGVLWGADLLLNPALAIPTAIWALFEARERHWPARTMGVGFLAAVLTCLPWTIRNYRVLGGFVPIRDNLGLELQVSNNDYAAPGILQNAESFVRFHPSKNAEQIQAIQKQGELRYGREKLRQAEAWIAVHPRRFLTLTIERVLQFWFPPVSPRRSPFVSIGIWLVTLLSVPGIVLVLKRSLPYGKALLWMLALGPIPYYVVQADPRYRMPFLWMSLLLAGYAMHLVVRRFNSKAANPDVRT